MAPRPKGRGPDRGDFTPARHEGRTAPNSPSGSLRCLCLTPACLARSPTFTDPQQAWGFSPDQPPAPGLSTWPASWHCPPNGHPDHRRGTEKVTHSKEGIWCPTRDRKPLWNPLASPTPRGLGSFAREEIKSTRQRSPHMIRGPGAGSDLNTRPHQEG